MMEYGPGDPVWLLAQDSPTPYFSPGRVLEFHKQGNVLSVEEEGTNVIHTYELPSPNVKKRLDEGDGDVEDMVQLIDLSEPSLLWNIKRRYESELIYTYIGSILISVNPYRMSDTLYGQAVVKEYEGKVLGGTLPPHLFAIGSSAYTNMMKDKLGQVVVISGESGSGKTESTKLILGYLALVNKCPSNLITEQILEASPLLESFGNAKTIKNDNSSRFGKYLQIYYSETGGSITGARITEYLLEKSRICTQSPEERNYHVFYEILKGLSREQKEQYGLTSAEKYFYLNQGGGRVATSKNDLEDFKALMSAFQILGFGAEEVDIILRILSAVLHLGNVYFHRKALKHGQEGVEIGSEAEIQWISHLLQISCDGIKKSLTTKITEARKERLSTPLTIDQSLDSRDAIAKVLYSSLFTWLVSRVNRIVFKGETRLTINILDIFGFEDFQENNTFEQLCINYANESLQHYHNKHIFKLEQQEYTKEKIDWTPINYIDNTAVLNLLAKKPVGILHLLDDESNFPKGTDTSFLEKAHYNHALSPHYTRPRLSSPSFTIKHFAGSVTYSVTGFLEKNRDTLRLDVARLLSTSTIPIIARIFQLHHSMRHQPYTVKPRAPTIAARFHDSLQQLLNNMSKQAPWFIRCFKPNSLKKAEHFDPGLMLEQIRYSGLLETIKIRKHGYAIRMDYKEFSKRFGCLCPREFLRSLSPRDASRLILSKHNDFQLGLNKVFLREQLHQKLELELYNLCERAAIRIQTGVRSYLIRKNYLKLRRAAILIQSLVRMRRERGNYKELKKSAIIFQKSWRRRRALKQIKRKKLDSSCLLPLNHLEIPPSLAYTFKKLENLPPIDIIKIQLDPSTPRPTASSSLPPASTNYNLGRLQREIKKILAMKREPISVPFLPNSDVNEAQAVFKLILRYMNSNLTEARQGAVVNYISKAEDETILQVMNQLIGNGNEENRERGLLLLANVLSVVRPSSWLLKYMLNFIEEPTYSNSYALLHTKLAASAEVKEQRLNLSVLEVRCNKSKSNMGMPVHYFDGGMENFELSSWMTVGELGSMAASRRFDGVGGGGVGWNLELNEHELEHGAYLLDVIGGMEFGNSHGFLFGSGLEPAAWLGGGRTAAAAEESTAVEGKVSPPGRISNGGGGGGTRNGGPGARMSEMGAKNGRSGGGGGPEVSPRNGIRGSQEMLKGSGGTKHQQQQHQQQHARSMDDLSNSNYGLSPSKLNDRYRASQEKLVDLDDEEDDDDDDRMEDDGDDHSSISSLELYPVLQKHNIDDLSSATTAPSGRSGHPRFIKSKRSSNSSVKHYELKSSAMSDTSEAPSLASHVRRVRVPSVGSDVEQFLDDLFSPVLGLDDMSDVRSLSSRIKGGGEGPFFGFSPSAMNLVTSPNTTSLQRAFLQSAMQQNVQIQQQLIQQNNALQQLLAAPLGGGGPLPPSTILPPSSSSSAAAGATQYSSSIPPPPPLPTELIDHGSRPFVDPYGRAKTVRIGKWRWPPSPAGPNDNFTEFKQRQEAKSSIVVEPVIKVARPFGNELVGKLKISSEMREKLELVTSSVRGGAGVKKRSGLVEEEIVIKKIGEDRKMVLAEKLGGGGGGMGGGGMGSGGGGNGGGGHNGVGLAPPPPPPVMRPSNNGGGGEHGAKILPPPPPPAVVNGVSAGKLGGGIQLVAPCYTYNRVPWVFRLRKEVFAPGETLTSPLALNLIFLQIIRDVFKNNIRIQPSEAGRMRQFLQDNQITPSNLQNIKIGLKKNIIEVGKSWALYFSKIWRVETTTEVKYISVNSHGLSLIRKAQSQLQILERHPFNLISSFYVDESGKIQLSLTSGQRLTFYSRKCDDDIEYWIGLFMKSEQQSSSSMVASSSSPSARHHGMGMMGGGGGGGGHGGGGGGSGGGGDGPIGMATPAPPPPANRTTPGGGGGGGDDNDSRSSSPSFDDGDLNQQQHQQHARQPPIAQLSNNNEGGASHQHQQQHQQQGDGKHSLVQFAIEHFRRDKFKLNDPNGNSWNWSEQMQLVKYSPQMLETSLLPLDDGNNLKALENYASIMRYMGDAQGVSEVEAVYTLLRNCHTSPPLRDELYCQMMKQTTNNPNTAQRGWRLFTILSAYFTCSDELRPYLFKYLESTAYDKRRPFHGTALVTLQNLRKTFKYGGRRNVPSVEEITAITAGRNAKRQIFRLPGGTQRVLNVKMSSVVKDIIEEMCSLLNITSPEEREEFSIYCIVEGDTFTMPLMKEEYILDVTTELYKNQQVFYLIFCRSVWSFPLRFDSESYIEVAFNQVAPDYLEGLLLVMPGGTLKQSDVHDIARIAALLHSAASLTTQPTLKETKYLLPKPALAARDLKPNQWVHLVNTYWNQVKSLTQAQAKATVLQTLQSWSLFGSSFFSVRRISANELVGGDEEFILALNKNGIHFLDVVTHEPVSSAPYSEIISTRKVKNEDGILFLDIKFGNLLQQKITRIQTEHAHEISRLIRMYISIQQKMLQQPQQQLLLQPHQQQQHE